MKFFFSGKYLRPTLVHGDRGEKRILTNILQALLHSKHEVITDLKQWTGPDPAPYNLGLGCSPVDDKYDAVVGWNVNVDIGFSGGKTRIKYREVFPKEVPIISYYMNGMDSLNKLVPKVKGQNPLIVPVNTFKLSKQHPDSISLPVPMFQSVSTSNNFDSPNFIFTLRSGFTDGTYHAQNIAALRAILNGSWGLGPEGKVYILEALPADIGSDYIRRVTTTLGDLSPGVEKGRIVILPCQMYERVLRILSGCKMSIALHPISGSKIQSAAMGCLPTLFSDGWWDKGAGWQAVQEVRGKFGWDSKLDDVRLSGKQLTQKIRYFCENRDAYSGLLNRCQLYATKNHTYEAFVDRLVEIVERAGNV